MTSLDGASVVVTGAGSGLGLALVERFVAEGARVVAFDRSAEKLELIEAKYGRQGVAVVVGDVTNFDDNARACAQAVDEFGRLDTFIGNAGLWDFGRSLEDSSPAQLAAGFNELFAVNVKAYLLGAKAALPALRETRGAIVLTLSNAAFYPMGGGPLYVASKHAGVGLVKQLAYELAPEIRVNAVAPGGMASDLRGPSSMDLAGTSITDAIPITEVMRANHALHVDVVPADYTGAYVLLAARSQSSTVTGTVIDVSSFGIQAKTTG